MLDVELVLDKNFKDKIKQGVQKILNAFFISGPKTEIKDLHNRLMFACPYCGDSDINKRKKRGNLFWDTLYYHCYNGGCNVHKPLYLFFEDFNVNILVDDKLAILDYIKKNKSKYTNNSDVLEFDFFKKLNELSVPIDLFYKITDTVPAFKSKEAIQILKQRLLINKLEYFSWKKNKLFILNLTSDKKNVIGYQIRKISNDDSCKYLTYHIERLRQQANLSILDKCKNEFELNKLNKFSTIFGILTVDFTKTVTIFEGPIDSMFMQNSIAMTGVTKNSDIFDDIPTVRFFYDNDESGKKAAIQKIKNNISVFLWQKFINDFNLKKYINKGNILKDLNDLVKMCYQNKLDYYKYLDNYFSNKIIDLYYI